MGQNLTKAAFLGEMKCDRTCQRLTVAHPLIQFDRGFLLISTTYKLEQYQTIACLGRTRLHVTYIDTNWMPLLLSVSLLLFHKQYCLQRS